MASKDETRYGWKFPDGTVIPEDDEWGIEQKLEGMDSFREKLSNDELLKGYWYTDHYYDFVERDIDGLSEEDMDVGEEIERMLYWKDDDDLAYYGIRRVPIRTKAPKSGSCKGKTAPAGKGKPASKPGSASGKSGKAKAVAPPRKRRGQSVKKPKASAKNSKRD